MFACDLFFFFLGSRLERFFFSLFFFGSRPLFFSSLVRNEN